MQKLSTYIVSFAPGGTSPTVGTERAGARDGRTTPTLWRVTTGLLLSLALAACHDDPPPTGPGARIRPRAASGPTALSVRDRYVVVYQDAVVDPAGEARRDVARHQGKLHFAYGRVLKGYAATLPPAAVAALRSDPRVKYVVQDGIVRINGTQTPTSSWGLDRIDQRGLPLNSVFTYGVNGSGVRVYGIDTGIRRTHTDFGGRAFPGFDAIGDGFGTNDCNGHGTHTAATAVGAKYGVAKGATVVAVRVLNCGGSGYWSGVIAGVDWVTQNAVKPAVAIMSLGGGAYQPLDDAVANSINSGVVYAVAAGNDYAADACYTSPARTAAALTVAATSYNDTRASFSNVGSCVDIFAPGDYITSAVSTDDYATDTWSGTSMATPHVAGAAALYLQLHPTATAAQVAQALVGNATTGVVLDAGTGTPNRLLYTGFIAPPSNWAKKAAMPTARRALAVGVINGILYAVGGWNGTTTYATVQSYNAATNSWTSRAPLPAARSRANGTSVLDGKLYVAGGYNASGGLTSSLYVYNPGTNTWATKAAMPITSGCGASTVINGKLYVFTGCTAGASNTGRLHRYDPSTNTWTALAQAPRAHAYPAAGMVNGKLYVAGGYNSSGAVTSAVDVYDAATNTWTAKAAMPTGAATASGRVLNGKLYVVGGRDAANKDLAALQVYNPVANSWSKGASMPTPRRAVAAGIINGVLYGVGGSTTSTSASTANESYTP